MQATFCCPGCDKRYPALPTLVGRPVRCSGCKQVFILGADGLAQLVEVAAPPPQPAADPEPAARDTPPPAPATPVPSPAPARPQTVSIQRKHERIKAALRSAAAGAMDGLGQEPATATAAAGPPAATAARRRPAAGAPAPTAAFTPVRTSDASGDERRVRLALALTLVGLMGVVIALWLALRPGPRERALARFAAPVDEGRLGAPERHHAILDRGWLRTTDGESEAEVVLALDQVDFGPLHRLPLAELHGWWRNHLQGLERRPDLGCWLVPGTAGAAVAIRDGLEDPGDRATWAAELRRAGHRVVLYEEVPPLLSRAGLADAWIYAVSLLLAGSAEIADPAALLEAQLGMAELQRFDGIDGRSLHPSGEGYTSSEAPRYWGLLLRAPPGTHPLGGDWRVLVIHPREWTTESYADRRNPLVRHARNLSGDLRAVPQEVAAAREDATRRAGGQTDGRAREELQ